MMSVLSSANRRSYSHSSYDSTSKSNCHQPLEAIRALAVLCLILLQHQTVLSEADDDYFMPLVTCDTSKANPYVKVSGTQFSLGGRPFKIIGWNSYRLVDVEVDDWPASIVSSLSDEMLESRFCSNGRGKGRGGVSVAAMESSPDDIDNSGFLEVPRTTQHLRQATALGLNTLRMWTWNFDHRLQISPGRYNETVFRALDRVLADAAQHRIKVILVFANNWDGKDLPPGTHNDGTIAQYVAWSEALGGEGMRNENMTDKERHATFFSDNATKAMFSDHMRAVIMRNNSVTGRLYRDDPTIMAWNLINEPRCEGAAKQGCPELLQEWIEEMASTVKQLDSNHLLTVGEEGFFAEGSPWMDSNPSSWQRWSGQDFWRNHNVTGIDYSAFHIWPMNWKAQEWSMKDWINIHVEVSELLNMPVMIEEFGLLVPGREHANHSAMVKKDRDPVFKELYGIVEGLSAAKRGMAGSLMWNLEVEGMDKSDTDPYAIEPWPHGSSSASTQALIRAHAERMHRRYHMRP